MFVDELKDFKPISEGIVSNFNIDKRKRNDYFGFEYDGYIKISKDGKYTFSKKTNDGSTLYIDGKEFNSGHTVALKKGMYKISEKYFQMGARYWNIVSWEGPGIPYQEIPANVLFHEE